MTYELCLVEAAFKEWRKLDATTRDQFKAADERRADMHSFCEWMKALVEPPS